MSQLVLTDIDNRIGTVRLNRPEKRNALSPELVEELKQSLRAMEKDDAVKVIRIKAEGKAFCAGADLAYIQQMQEFTPAQNLADSKNLMELFELIYNFPKVIVAEVQGHALAGGCGLVTVCDFAFSAPEVLLGFTEVKIGFVPALVSVYLQEQIGTAPAQELLLSGDLISSTKAASLGLITAVAHADLLEKTVLDFCGKLISENSGFSMGETKKLFRSIHQSSRVQALQLAAEVNAQARSHEDCKHGIASFLSKSKPTW